MRHADRRISHPATIATAPTIRPPTTGAPPDPQAPASRRRHDRVPHNHHPITRSQLANHKEEAPQPRWCPPHPPARPRRARNNISTPQTLRYTTLPTDQRAVARLVCQLGSVWGTKPEDVLVMRDRPSRPSDPGTECEEQIQKLFCLCRQPDEPDANMNSAPGDPRDVSNLTTKLHRVREKTQFPAARILRLVDFFKIQGGTAGTTTADRASRGTPGVSWMRGRFRVAGGCWPDGPRLRRGSRPRSGVPTFAGEPERRRGRAATR